MSSKEFTAKTFRFLHQVNGNPNLSAADLKVALGWTRYFTEADEDGRARVGAGTVAKDIGLAECTVTRSLHRLEAQGHIRVIWGKQGRGHPNQVWMVVKRAKEHVSEPRKCAGEDAVKRARQPQKTCASAREPSLNHEGGTNVPPSQGEREDALTRVSDPAAVGAPGGAHGDQENSAPRPSSRPKIIPPGSFEALRSVWARPWPDDDAADRRAFATACREVAPDVIVEAATQWAQAVEARFLSPLAKWLTARGWEKALPAKGHAARRRAPQHRNGGKVEITKVFFRQAGWRQNADGSLTCPKTGRTWGAAQ